MKRILLLSLIILTISVSAQKNSKLIIGTYTNGKSEGIYVYDFNTKTGDNTFVSSIKTSNPSFIAVSPNKKYVYAVNEDADAANNGGAVSAFKFNKKKGLLRFINQQPSGGNHPCYITFDKTGKWVIVANYSGGSLSLLPVNKNGSVATAKTVINHKGKSINKNRQESAHVHSTVLTPDNKNLLVADLGTDKLMLYNFDDINGTLTENSTASIKVNSGAGPRHIALDPSGKYVYLTEELSGTIGVFSLGENATLKLLQTISAVAENYKGSFGGADIHVSPDGKFLYASNRGEANTIAIFSVDTNTGLLTAIAQQSTMGVMPRNFNFDPSGNFLLVANQQSGGIVIFSVNHQTGLLTDTGKRIDVPNPVCIKWVN